MSDVNKTNTLEQANAPPDTELVIPENLPPIKVMNPGLYKNLCEQVASIHKHCNELSYGTRKRYYEATKRFCAFLADNFRLEKFKNVEDRHFRAYVEHLIESGTAPATIQSDLSGIRFFHRKSGSKNKLSENERLNLPKRAVGTENRAWLPEEKEKARAIAEEMGRTDVVLNIFGKAEISTTPQWAIHDAPHGCFVSQTHLRAVSFYDSSLVSSTILPSAVTVRYIFSILASKENSPVATTTPSASFAVIVKGIG